MLPARFWKRTDPGWRYFLREHLLAGVSAGLSCAEAIVASANHFCEEFARSSSSYLQERALDVRDVCFQLLQQIYGEQRFPAPGKLTQPAICMADELTPASSSNWIKIISKVCY